MKMKQILGAGVVIVSLLFMVTPVVSAQGTPGNVQVTPQSGTPGNVQVSNGGASSGGTQLVNPIKADTFSELVALVIDTAVSILVPFVVLAFIYSGFLFVKAQGKEKELEEAKKAIYWSVIGAFILFGAAGFAALLSQTLSTVIN